MSRTLDTLLRPSLLAMAIALSAPLTSTALIAAEQASNVRAYNLPAAPLASTLNQIASQSGLALTLNPSLAAGKTSAPVKGQFDAQAVARGVAWHRVAIGAKQCRDVYAGACPGRCRGVARDQHHWRRQL